jgi:phage/plasmid-associated DNA primase
MARCAQHPDRHAEVAVVLRGVKGTGKGMIAQIMARILANHSLHITHSRHLVGNFNAHLVDALFLFLDEAFWAGDRAGEGTLKALITERSLMIEPKGIDPFMMPNRLKIMIASNEDWVIPASADERRYFVLDVSDSRRGDRMYFTELAQAIEGQELQALLHHLLTLDLMSFDFRNPPHTEGLNKQKLASGDSFAKFWYDCLCNGVIMRSGEEEWPERIQVDLLYAAYLDYAKDHGDRYPLTSIKMAERLGKLMPDGNLRRRRPQAKDDSGFRPREYIIPLLDAARVSFEQAMNMDSTHHTWPEDEP